MSLSVEKFARWLRAISTILLARNSTSDRTKAVGYVEQAVAVLEEHSQNLQQEMENVRHKQTLMDQLMGLIHRSIRWMNASGFLARLITLALNAYSKHFTPTRRVIIKY